MKEIKLKRLEKSFEEGIISKDEYEKKKVEIEALPEEKLEEKKEKVEEPKLKSDKLLIIAAVLLIIIFVSLFGYRFLKADSPETIDELHAFNLKGKLKPDQGYLYRDIYSFVKLDDLWYTQLKSPQGSRLYDIQFRYGPRDVEDIDITGKLNTELMDNANNYYVTFNPAGNDFSHVAIAVADFNQHMVNIFFKNPIAACDRNGTAECINRPIITCDNTEELVLYVKEANESKVYFDDNCIVVEGSGFDLVKGVDRILLEFYKIIV